MSFTTLATKHGTPDLLRELAAIAQDVLPDMVVDGGMHTTSGSTSATISHCRAYIQGSYVEEGSSRTVTYSGGDGTYWLALTTRRGGSAGSWTRVAGTYYIYQKSTTLPTLPANAMTVGKVTVASGAISAFEAVGNRIISQPVTISENITLSDLANWAVARGALLTIASGKTLTFADTPLTAGRYQIFAGAGSVAGNVLTRDIYAEWFGLGTTDDGPAFNKAITLAQAKGGRVTFARRNATIKVATSIAIAKGIYFGSENAIVATATSGPNTNSGPVIEWTGGASPIIDIAIGAHMCQVDGFALNNTGTATHGIRVAVTGSGALHGPRLMNLACVIPTTAFSTAGIGVCDGGANQVIRFTMDNVHFRKTAPVGLDLSLCQNLSWITRSSFHSHIGSNIRIGNSGQCRELKFAQCETHQDDGTTNDYGFHLVNVRSLDILQHYFELHSLAAGSLGIYVPASATRVSGVTVRGCNFNVNDALTACVQVALNDGLTSLVFSDNHIQDSSSGTLTTFIDNDLTSQGIISLHNNIVQSANAVTIVNDPRQVIESDNFIATSSSTSLLSPTASRSLDYFTSSPRNSVGSTETDLYSVTLPSNFYHQATGHYVDFLAHGVIAANTNTKNIRAYIGGNVVLTLTSTSAITGRDWFIRISKAYRLSSTRIAALVEGYIDDDPVNPNSVRTAFTLTFSSPIVIKVTGQGVADNDITCDGGIMTQGGW